MKTVTYLKVQQTFRLLAVLYLVGISLSLLNCSIARRILSDDLHQSKNYPKISFRAGAASGGLVENSEMSGIGDISELDAITGATKTLYNAGVHTEVNLKGHKIETGIDYIGFDQSVKYELPSLSIDGKRDFRFHQLRLPLTYNLHLFKNRQSYPKLVLQGGISVGYTFVKSVTDHGNVPDYEFKSMDYGPALGITIYPINPIWKYRLGIYIDLYRGSQIYSDIYHRAEGIGGHSFMMFGFVFSPLFFE